MRISDTVKRCVGFVGIREGRDIKWGGTVFFINITDGGLKFCYMVTAKHVAEALEGSDCVLRVNSREGHAVILEASATKWWYHPSESAVVDSAVAPLAPLTRDFDIATISHTLFATPEVIQEYEFGIGDEVYVSGLFTRVTRTARIQPVVRTGTIAMMPDEKIEFSTIGLIEAYLIETKSFGGLSGCPVFARHTVSLPTRRRTQRTADWEIQAALRRRLILPSRLDDRALYRAQRFRSDVKRSREHGTVSGRSDPQNSRGRKSPGAG